MSTKKRTGLIAELKRRNVFRVGAGYLALIWVVIEVTSTLAPALQLPAWSLNLVLWLGAFGFPFALLLAWVFEWTPQGIKRDSDEGTPELRSRGAGRKTDFAIISLLLVALGLVIWDAYLSETAVSIDSGFAAQAPVASIAVLPFVDRSAEQDQEFFSDGMSEELLNLLARVPGLKVAGRTSSFSFRDSNADHREIGSALNVNTLLEGSVRKSGDQLRITVQLINVADGFNLWSNTYDRKLTDVFAVQEEISWNIVAAMRSQMGLAGLTISPTRRDSVDPRAYEHFLLGRHLLAQRTAGGELDAEDHFRLATEIDPSYASAWAWLAISRGFWLYDEDVGKAAKTAFSLAPDLPAAHLALHAADQWFYKGTESMRHLRRAIELDPNNASAHHWLGNGLEAAAQYSEMLGARQRAIEIEPLMMVANYAQGDIYAFLGLFAEAESVKNRMGLIDATNPMYHQLDGVLNLHRGDYAEAAAALQRGLEAGGNEYTVFYATTVFSMLGLTDRIAPAYDNAGMDIQSRFYEGNIAAARELVQKMLDSWPQSALVYRMKGDLEFLAGDYEAATEAYRSGFACQDAGHLPRECRNFAVAADRAGATETSRNAVAALRNVLHSRSREQSEPVPFTGWFGEGTLLAIEGETDRAIVALNEAVDSGYLTYGLRDGPAFEDVRRHPEYPPLEEKSDKLMRIHLERLAELEQPQ